MIRDDNLSIVIDTTTGLMWDDDYLNVKREPITWQNAISFCDSLTIDSHSDWRLPNINELISITDNSTHDPALNSNFKYVASDQYWSSTTSYALSTPDYKQVWLIDFNTSQTISSGNKSDIRYYRCVRTY